MYMYYEYTTVGNHPKAIVIARVEFELAYFEAAVQYFRLYAM